MTGRIVGERSQNSNYKIPHSPNFPILSSLLLQISTSTRTETGSQLRSNPPTETHRQPFEMARTKFTGPKREPSPAPSPPSENTNDGAPIMTLEGGAREPISTPADQQVVSKTPEPATSEVPGRRRIIKRAKGATKFPKEVLILYEALVYGIDAKVSSFHPYLAASIF